MKTTTESTVDVEALRSSPIHGIQPTSLTSQLIDIDSIEDDETNPGTLTESLRYQRREPSIRDSYDIIGRIVYPIIVCQHPEKAKRERGLFLNVDGHGRRDQAKRRNEIKIWAIIYPPLSLEQRICLRQTLGAAQETFDAVSVMRDLKILASERHLDVHNPDDIAVLIRDLPEKVRKYGDDLIMLARWELPTGVELGESYKKKDRTVIGLDKVRGMTRIVDAVKDRHPQIYRSVGGDTNLTRVLAKMYVDGKFSTGSRSQDSIRKVASGIEELPTNDTLVARFFAEELDYAVLAPFAKGRQRAPRDLLSACEILGNLLFTTDAGLLSDPERRALGRVNTLIAELLKAST